MTKYQVIGTVGFLAGVAVAFLMLTGSAAAQVRGVAAVPAEGFAPAPRLAPAEEAYAGYEPDPDLDRQLAGSEPSGEAYRDDAGNRGRDYGVRGSDGRYYEPADAYDGYDGYTDQARAYTDRYRPEDRHGYDGRGYYDRSYDRDYRRRYPQPRLGSVYLGGGSWGSSFGISFDLGDVTLGYRDGYRDSYYVYYNGHNRYRHKDWRRGYTGRFGCHPVTYRQWRYGRPYTVTSTMCYDRYGYGYVVPGRRGYW